MKKKKFHYDLAPNKTKGYSNRYINDDFNASAFEPIYDYDLQPNTQTEIDRFTLRKEAIKNNDENLEIYPDPDDFHRRMLNKSRMENRHHDDTVIKICKFSPSE
jgi:hypothetical protein